MYMAINMSSFDMEWHSLVTSFYPALITGKD